MRSVPAGFGRPRARTRCDVLALISVAALGLASCSAGGEWTAPPPESGTGEPPASTVAAATSSPPASAAATSTTSTTSTTVSPEQAAVERYRGVLEASGITIDDAAASAGPFAVPTWQLASLSAEATSGGGVAGALIDRHVPMPEELPPLSAIIGGWVTSSDTPGAMWAADVLDGADWSAPAEVRFPTAALNLFVHDVLTSATEPIADDGEPSGLRAPPALPPPSDGCPVLTAWADAQMQLIFTTAGTLASAGTIPPPVGGWIHVGGQLVLADAGFLATLIETQWAVFAIPVAQALVVLGTIGLLSGMLAGWTATVSPSTPTDRFAVGTEPDRPQRFTAAVVASIPVWPDFVLECASSVGIDLPDPTGAGSSAQWSVVGLPQYGTETARDATFGSDGTAAFDWVTGREPDDAGDERVGVVDATVIVDLEARQKLLAVWSAAFTSALNNAGPLAQAVAMQIPDLLATFDDVLEASTPLVASASVAVTHHDACELEPGTLRDGTWTGPLVADATGTFTGSDNATDNVGEGVVIVVIEEGVVTGGEWTLDWTASGYAISDAATAEFDGLVGHASGDASGAASAPTFSGTATLQGTIRIVSPVQLDIPLDNAEPATATMTLVDVGCDVATGTFLPSFNQQASGIVVFEGIATWTGSRTD